MPAGYQKIRPHPNQPKPMTLAEAAELGNLIKLRCNGCRRTTYYLASDLAEVYGPTRAALDPPPIVCSRCGTDEMLRVEMHSPSEGDWGRLPIRRPGPVRHIQTWRGVKLGDP